MESVDDVIREIEGAFRAVPLGQLTLHEAELLDNYGATADERAAARVRDPERDWRDVPDSSIRECSAALSFLDPVSWRFYLPAYLRYGLRHSADTAIYSLDPAGIRQHERYLEERFGTLDDEQVQAVCSFLRFASRHPDLCDDVAAKDALDDYWSERGRLTAVRSTGKADE